MRSFFLVTALLVSCGSDDSSNTESNTLREVTLTYLSGSEKVSVLSCEVSSTDVVENVVTIETSPAELAAIDAVCEGAKCKLTNNFRTKEVVCGNQEIYKGTVRKKEFKEYYAPF